MRSPAYDNHVNIHLSIWGFKNRRGRFHLFPFPNGDTYPCVNDKESAAELSETKLKH